MEELESTTSDVESTESSSDSQPSNDPAPASPGGEAADKQTNSEQQQPFHEHPRFKELVEQKNKALEASKALEERYTQMQAKLDELSRPKAQESPDKRAKMIERLKSIDPEFAEVFSELVPSKEMEALKNEYRQMQEKSFINEAVNTINKLNVDNKVDAKLAPLYQNQMDYFYRTGQIKSQADVTRLYNEMHSTYKNIFDARDRAARESYVAGKKTDTKVPTSQPKGKPAPTAPKMEWSKDPEERRAQIVARYLKTSKASNTL